MSRKKRLFVRSAGELLHSLPHIIQVRTKVNWYTGQRHLRHLKQHSKVFYTNLLIGGKLHSYFINISKDAKDIFVWLVER